MWRPESCTRITLIGWYDTHISICLASCFNLTVGCGGHRRDQYLHLRDEPASALEGTESAFISWLRQVILPILPVLKPRWAADQSQFFYFFPSEEEQLPHSFPWGKGWHSERFPLAFRWSASGKPCQAFLLLKYLLIICMDFVRFFYWLD